MEKSTCTSEEFGRSSKEKPTFLDIEAYLKAIRHLIEYGKSN